MSPEKILNYLNTVPNQNLWLNALVHLMVLAAILVLVFVKNGKLKRWAVDGTILLLFVSITVVAKIYGNPFHFVTIGLLALVAGIELWRGRNEFEPLKFNLQTVLAFASILTGFWYPEFVKVTPFAMLLLSPAGIVPCPTLLIVLGLIALAYPKVNKLQYFATVFMAAVYGVIGVFGLKVYLDAALLIMTAAMICRLFQSRFSKQDRKAKTMVQ